MLGIMEDGLNKNMARSEDFYSEYGNSTEMMEC
jgi:hypothetical protein